MLIAVTGGCGFIGANLVRLLLDRGFSVKVLDNLSAGKKENLPAYADLIVGDIRDPKAVQDTVRRANAVVHLAARTSVMDSVADPETCFEVNVRGTLNLLEAAVRSRVQSLVFASSNAALGEQPAPVHEAMAPRPSSPYGASKLAGEALCSAFSNSYGLKTTSLRFANVYGPYSSHKTSVVAKFVRQLREGKKLTVYGDGTQTRDFIHVYDVCEAIYLALREPKATGLYQIGSGVPTSVLSLIKMILEIAGHTADIEYLPPRAGEIRHSYALIDRARAELGFQPRICLREGLTMLLHGRS